jgi:hypothetical protein
MREELLEQLLPIARSMCYLRLRPRYRLTMIVVGRSLLFPFSRLISSWIAEYIAKEWGKAGEIPSALHRLSSLLSSY